MDEGVGSMTEIEEQRRISLFSVLSKFGLCDPVRNDILLILAFYSNSVACMSAEACLPVTQVVELTDRMLKAIDDSMVNLVRVLSPDEKTRQVTPFDLSPCALNLINRTVKLVGLVNEMLDLIKSDRPRTRSRVNTVDQEREKYLENLYSRAINVYQSPANNLDWAKMYAFNYYPKRHPQGDKFLSGKDLHMEVKQADPYCKTGTGRKRSRSTGFSDAPILAFL